jgi:predicted nucleic acid-binding protein
VVCDAGPLIHLDELGCLDLLSDFIVLIPDAVWQEVLLHRATIPEREDPHWTRLPVPPPDEAGFMGLARALTLGAGEQAALAAVRAHPGAMLLTDDAAARLAAEQLGMRVHGTIGILLRAIRRGLRTPAEVLALLRAIPQRSTLHIRADLLNEIIARVQQEAGLG